MGRRPVDADDEARGARLKALRESKGWSHQKLAERAGFPDPGNGGRLRVSRLEKGELRFTSVDQQAGYAQAFGVSVGEILEYALGQRALMDLLACSTELAPGKPDTSGRYFEPDDGYPNRAAFLRLHGDQLSRPVYDFIAAYAGSEGDMAMAEWRALATQAEHDRTVFSKGLPTGIGDPGGFGDPGPAPPPRRKRV